ncbi:MAG TPA: NAD(P)H-binding protein [Terriglobia bacterium]|nr:NAD(P)H-binding protein [Terriglobia bacterium]
MYIVTGATGHTGRAVTETLLAQGKPVTVVARDPKKAENWKKQGAKIVKATLEDAASMQRALSGADGAYLLVPPNYGAPNFLEDRRRVTDAVAEAVRASRIPHIVVLSSVGGHLASGTGLILSNHYAEEALGGAAPNVTILRPAYFIENWEASAGAVKTEGILYSFLDPQRKIPMIATLDIGRIAAECLLNPARGRRVLEMAGPQDYSPEDIAAAFATVLGRPVRVHGAPLSAIVPTLTPLGFSPDVARLFEEMTGGINSGHVAYEGKGIEFRRGTVAAREVIARMTS